MKFIIAAPPFNPAYGGIIALHYLAHLLVKNGHDCKVASTSTFPDSAADVLLWEFGTPVPNLIDGDEMVIYPEIINDNPLGATHVTRWILYKEGILSKPIEYGKRDLIFQWGQFHRPLKKKSLGVLRVRWTRTDIFRDFGQTRNQWFAHIVRKGNFKKPYEWKTRRHPPKSQFLDKILTTGLEEAAATFNNIRIVVCYDSESNWAYCAALCGCIVVIVPTRGISRKDYWKNFPIAKNGIAYGWGDLLRAFRTKNRLLDAVENEERSNRQSVQAYLKVVEDYFIKGE